MLTIINLYRIIGKEIQTTNAYWKIMNMYERTNDYMIKVIFRSGKMNTQTYPNHINFRILRESTKNEWRMYNDQNGNYITLTKGYLHDLKVFIGILGGQLDNINK
jgi:uncharacterized protein with FMN-binding domain